MKNAIYILLSLVAAAVGIYEVIAYINSVTRLNPHGNMTALVIGVVCILAALAFAGLFLSGRVNKEEELHITQ
jgi:ABC-type multidrug transport system permease subunit